MRYNASMSTVDDIRALNGASAYQRGLFTAAQAKHLGVERWVLSRLEKAGAIERLAKGVYRMGGAPSVREEDVVAAWLSVDPGREPGSPPDPATTPVASGPTAAWLLGIGEIGPEPLEFCCAERRQTKRAGLRLRKRAIDPAEVTIAGGVPATSAFLTVLDLVDAGEDLSLVSGVLRDALAEGMVPDRRQLAEMLDKRSGAAGLPRGMSLYGYLTEGRR